MKCIHPCPGIEHGSPGPFPKSFLNCYAIPKNRPRHIRTCHFVYSPHNSKHLTYFLSFLSLQNNKQNTYNISILVKPRTFRHPFIINSQKSYCLHKITNQLGYSKTWRHCLFFEATSGWVWNWLARSIIFSTILIYQNSKRIFICSFICISSLP